MKSFWTAAFNALRGVEHFRRQYAALAKKPHPFQGLRNFVDIATRPAENAALR
jgi:hypothetical protein